VRLKRVFKLKKSFPIPALRLMNTPLIAGRAVVPELIQDDFTPQRVAEEAEKLLSTTKEGKARVETITRGLEEVRRLLGPPGAVERAADEIAKLLTAAQSKG